MTAIKKFAYILAPIGITSALAISGIIGYDIGRNSRDAGVNNLMQEREREIRKPMLYGFIEMGKNYGVSTEETARRFREYVNSPDFDSNDIDGCRVIPEACWTLPKDKRPEF